MTRTVEFLYDYGSPFSYLADAVLPGFAQRTGAAIAFRPILLGGIFKAIGNRSPMQEPIEAKRAYFGPALQRTARLHGVPFAGNPHFPINTLPLMRGAVAARHLGVFEAYHAALYPAFWREQRNLADPAVVAEVLEKAGLDAVALAARANQDDVKAELRDATDDAVARGAFGAPTFFLDGEMFFGVDHLPHLERALQESRP
jgi:2-hydroxychromene-2-carboxylate isomerase